MRFNSKSVYNEIKSNRSKLKEKKLFIPQKMTTNGRVLRTMQKTSWCQIANCPRLKCTKCKQTERNLDKKNENK